MEAPGWVKSYLPLIVGGLVSVTIPVLVQSLGPLVLVAIWLSVFLVVVLYYALRWRSDLIRLKKEGTEPSIPIANPEHEARIRRLEADIEASRKTIMNLETKLEASKQVEAEERSTGLRTAQALAESEDNAMNLARQLEQLNEAVGKGKDVLLLTELNVSEDQPVDFVSKRLRRGMVIDILAQSPSLFSFGVVDSENTQRLLKGRQNFESLAGKVNTTIYKERLSIPRGDDWFFVVTQTEDVRATVRLVVGLVEMPE